MQTKLWKALLAAFFLFMIPAQAVLVTYDATADFTTANGNPNGVWSYGWMPTNFSTFTAYTNHSTVSWYGWGVDTSPAVWKNTASTTECGVAPGQISLHPGPGTEPCVLRFTALYTGTYSVMGQFFAGHSGIMQVGIRAGSTWLWNATDAGSFNFNRSITQGSSLDFVVYGGYGAGNTPISLVISGDVVPEASTLMCMALGMAVLLQRRLMRR